MSSPRLAVSTAARRRRTPRLVLAFEAFDEGGTREVLEAVREAPEVVVVDLSRAREIHASALAALAALAARSPVPVRVLGLRAHDRRVLRYLGFEEGDVFTT